MSWRKSASSGRGLLALGIGLRILAFPFLSPLNADYGHLTLVKYVAEHHVLFPLAADRLAFHPPLYYVLAAPFYAITGTAKGTQLLSLLLSILTLLLFYRLLYVENLIRDEQPRMYAFLLPCFLPPFILNSLIVSNDTLTTFFGALIVLQVVRFVAMPNNTQLLLLGLVEALGLCSKATFLAFLPGLFVLVLLVRLRQGRSVWNASVAALGLLLLSCGLGSYKFIQNYREAKNPFYSSLSLSMPWQDEQRATYRGAASFYDVNVLKLLKFPSDSPATDGAYPLILYGTFWYHYVPDSNFTGARHPPFYYLGSIIYLFALFPSVIIILGLFRLLKNAPRLITHFLPSRKDDQQALVSLTSVFFLLGILTLILSVTLKYHIWSTIVGRYLYPSFCGLLVAFGDGAAALSGQKVLDKTIRIMMISLVVCFGLYFASEIAYQILHLLVTNSAALFKRLS